MIFVFIGNVPEYDSRGGPQSAGLQKFSIYSFQVTADRTWTYFYFVKKSF